MLIIAGNVTNKGLDLFLIDNNERHPSTVSDDSSVRVRVQIRFPTYSKFSGGLLVPLHLSDNSYNVFDALNNTFQHLWTTTIVLDNDIVVNSEIFIYVLATSTAEHRLKKLRSHIRQVSFHAIRAPGIAITDSLHDAREDMINMRDAINETFSSISKHDWKLFEDLSQRPGDINMQGFMSRMQGLIAGGKELHEFFVETLQILAQTISIRDSQSSIKQAEESLQQTKQATMLTRLAAIYLPLSVSTGIFGMNLQEINNSSPKSWTFVITLVGLAILTASFLFVPAYAQNRRERRCECSKA